MNERLRDVFLEVFQLAPERYSEGLTPGDVKGWNSLGHLALVNALEAAFNVTLADDDVAEMESVARIKEILAKRGAV